LGLNRKGKVTLPCNGDRRSWNQEIIVATLAEPIGALFKSNQAIPNPNECLQLLEPTGPPKLKRSPKPKNKVKPKEDREFSPGWWLGKL